MPELVEQLARVRKRRICNSDEVPDGYISVINTGPIPFEKGLLYWIEEYTSGKFYIDPCTLAFEKSEDAVIFNMGFGKPEDKL